MTTNPQQISREIKHYLSALSVEDEESVLDALGEILWQRVAVRVASYLPEDKQGKLRELIDTNEVNTKELVYFLAKDIPNLADIVGEEAYNLREEYYAIVKAKE